MKDFFTIHQVSKACGISRATILRLESKGLLVPAYIDKQSGYRYFDNFNISAIMQIRFFLSIGMSYDDILLYYQSNGSSSALLKRMEDKYYMIKRAYEEIKMRTENNHQLTFEYVTLPSYTCYTKEFFDINFNNHYQAMYDLYHEVIEKGYQPLASQPLFVINKRNDFIQDHFLTHQTFPFVCCVPLEPHSAPKDATIIPSYKAFSCLYHGNYDHITYVYNEFGKKIRELQIEVIDYPRTLCLVAPYTGKTISPDNYISRLVVPIEVIKNH